MHKLQVTSIKYFIVPLVLFGTGMRWGIAGDAHLGSAFALPGLMLAIERIFVLCFYGDYWAAAKRGKDISEK